LTRAMACIKLWSRISLSMYMVCRGGTSKPVSHISRTITSFRGSVGFLKRFEINLVALFERPSIAAESAQAMTDDAVRSYHNPNLRVLDNPMRALDLLRDGNRELSTYKIESTKTMDGAQVVVLKFTEKDKGAVLAGASYRGALCRRRAHRSRHP